MSEDDTQPLEMLVRIVVAPDRVDAVLERFEATVAHSRTEDGCLEFAVCTSQTPGEIWLKEAFVSRAYHDDVHGTSEEHRALLGWLSGELTEPPTVTHLQRRLAR